MAKTVISSSLAAGSTTPPFSLDVTITQTLCKFTCKTNTPSFSPTFVLNGYTLVGTNTYEANISFSGLISYVPCGKCSCCTKTEMVSGTLVIPFYSATTPTSVSISQGTTNNIVVTKGCSNCSNVVRCDTPIFLTVA